MKNTLPRTIGLSFHFDRRVKALICLCFHFFQLNECLDLFLLPFPWWDGDECLDLFLFLLFLMRWMPRSVFVSTFFTFYVHNNAYHTIPITPIIHKTMTGSHSAIFIKITELQIILTKILCWSSQTLEYFFMHTAWKNVASGGSICIILLSVIHDFTREWTIRTDHKAIFPPKLKIK